ncbi:carboxylesterase family protein [Sphaerisporangium sp. B11E5]|uniref:carboxylesterase/lipase family protein n=1 Tax=Sphaerisporangium sp. B11E5 TaxID=3153563 RepID=UPI00325CA661
MVNTAVVRTRYGRLRGSRTEGVYSFKGVPYAAPPFGAGRFRPPRPVRPWDGVRDALAFGPEAPQPRPLDPRIEGLVPDPAVPGEDCLNLNIWTPETGAAGLPVMVWIPGGMFEAGSGASYDGSRFARDGVVCVTVNYRLGADGFLYLGEGSANLGLLDQLAALEWVRDDIAAFGGDPGNVTVFGESAGAMSVGTLLSMPRAAGLFRRAITQSGAAHTVMTASTARLVGERLAERLGVEATLEAIAAVPVGRLLTAQADLKAALAARPDPERWGSEVVATTMPWQPVVDGDSVPAPPIERIAAGAAADVDLMVGTNTDEWRLFLVLSGAIGQVTDDALAAATAACGLPAHAPAAYRAACPGAGPGDLLAAVQTDWWMRVPAIRLADAHAAAPSATFMYEFAWPSPEFGGLLGACHALEIPFVFDTLDPALKPFMGPLLGTRPPQRLADLMHASWTAFAAKGESGWPEYDLARRATMRFDTTSEVVDDPRSHERALWAGVR